MKKVLAFDIDQTLNIAKTPIDQGMALLLKKLLNHFLVCPISGQKFDQFLLQIVNQLPHPTAAELSNLHLFVAQGTQYYRFNQNSWQQVYSFPLKEHQIQTISSALEQAAKKLGFWESDQLKPGDQIIENRLSQVTFSALGQSAGTAEKYAWDPDCKKRQQIVDLAKTFAPEFQYEIGGTTSINAFLPGMNKAFGMEHLMGQLKVAPSDILYFGDMTSPGGNDYPVVEMGIDTITVRSHEDTAFALRGILGLIGAL